MSYITVYLVWSGPGRRELLAVCGSYSKAALEAGTGHPDRWIETFRDLEVY